jgi:hypothetical protein
MRRKHTEKKHTEEDSKPKQGKAHRLDKTSGYRMAGHVVSPHADLCGDSQHGAQEAKLYPHQGMSVMPSTKSFPRTKKLLKRGGMDV